MQRITELANPFTLGLDQVTQPEFVRRLRQADQQLFTGWDTHQNVYDIANVVAQISQAAAEPLRRTMEGTENNVFVFSGCGTSGRIAWLCARGLNAMVLAANPNAKPCFRYLLSGGDEALIVSKELPEDDPHLGAADLNAVVKGCDRSFFFGITCGLSAPYVAGQIELAMSLPTCTTVLIGFNPVSLARDAPVEGWTTTCKKVFTELERRCTDGDVTAYVLNPVVGPEAVTGSSRMKGGSMTKILLESVFLPLLAPPTCGFTKAINANFVANTNSDADNNTATSTSNTTSLLHHTKTIQSLVSLYETTYRDTYSALEDIAPVIRAAGECLQHTDSHLYYLGTTSFGLLGIVDASEMVDTYGSRLDEVRGFVQGGWSTCCNNEGDMTSMGVLFHISLDEFSRELMSKLTQHDMVIFVNLPTSTPVIKEIEASQARITVINVNSQHGVDEFFRPQSDNTRYDAVAKIDLSTPEPCAEFPVFAEFSLKLVLNLVTTGANVMKGSVFGNSMINLTVSNNKLFHRSAEIIVELTGATMEIAINSLIRAAHGVDVVTDELAAFPLSHHIEIATPKSNIVPTAALLATQKFGYSEATALLASHQPLRNLLHSNVKN
eukprot:m.14021 g.14021  ORF g.14021 m.14021 type:complete len:609 (-) comp9984_c0_seq1:88-1914(-)